MNNIDDRITRISHSKERLVECIKKDHQVRMMETQSRFQNNLKSFRNKVNDKFQAKVNKTEKQISALKQRMEEDVQSRHRLKQNSIDKVRQRNEELLAERKRELLNKNAKFDKH